MQPVQTSNDVLFILLGAIMVLAMHAGFAFLELGTVRRKNQVNALIKILSDFAVSTLAYFFIGYGIAYGVGSRGQVFHLLTCRRFSKIRTCIVDMSSAATQVAHLSLKQVFAS